MKDIIIFGGGKIDLKSICNKRTMMKYTFKEHLILEKSVRGTGGDISTYLINPTGPELIRFFSKTKEKSIRYISSESNLYVWDAFEDTHGGFLHDELLMGNKLLTGGYGPWEELDKKEGGPHIDGIIDPFGGSGYTHTPDGTDFDSLRRFVKIPSRKWQYKPLLQMFEWMLEEYKDYKGWRALSYEGVYSHRWYFNTKFKKYM